MNEIAGFAYRSVRRVVLQGAQHTLGQKNAVMVAQDGGMDTVHISRRYVIYKAFDRERCGSWLLRSVASPGWDEKEAMVPAQATCDIIQ